MVGKIQIEELTQEDTVNDSSLYTYWKSQIDHSREAHDKWLKESETYYKLYNNETNDDFDENSFNVLYSNTETKLPLLFSKLPKIDIRRRNLTNERISRITSELLERACNYYLDRNNFEDLFKKSIKDMLITSRGCVNVEYIPGLVNEDGKENVDDKLKDIKVKYVSYDKILLPPVIEWTQVDWIAYLHTMSQDEFKTNFPKINIDNIPFNSTTKTNTQKGGLKVDKDVDLHKRAEVWEIWDKNSKSIVFFVDDYTEKKILKKVKDAINLDKFFNTPKPLGSISNNRSVIPIPEYRQYRVQAEELNEIEDRIRKLIENIKYSGLFSGKLEDDDVKNLFKGEDGEFHKLKADELVNINNLIYIKDNQPIVATVISLYAQKQQIISDIKEITGISDIVRGVTKASETATAQKLKGDFAVSRLETQRREVEIYLRDTLEIIAELIAENFSVEELSKVSGLKIIDVKAIFNQAKQQLDKQLELLNSQAKQAIIQNPDKQQEIVGALQQQSAQLEDQILQKTQQEVQNMLINEFVITKEEAKEIEKVLKDDAKRNFMIDVETESTIKIDSDIDKQQRMELLTTISATINQMFPAVQAGVISQEAFKSLLKFTIQPFKIGRNFEQALTNNDFNAMAQQQEQAAQQQVQMEKEEREKEKEEREKEQKLKYMKVLLEEREIARKENRDEADFEMNKEKIESDELKAELNAEVQINKQTNK